VQCNCKFRSQLDRNEVSGERIFPSAVHFSEFVAGTLFTPGPNRICTDHFRPGFLEGHFGSPPPRSAVIRMSETIVSDIRGTDRRRRPRC
jgi:hypothetical protein